jgi:hypothetical protein
MVEIFRAMAVAARHVNRAFKQLSWDMKYGKMTDVEKLALVWATRHMREGRMDLAVEDFEWLGRRLDEGQGLLNAPFRSRWAEDVSMR